jgi:hypothetical protein
MEITRSLRSYLGGPDERRHLARTNPVDELPPLHSLWNLVSIKPKIERIW